MCACMDEATHDFIRDLGLKLTQSEAEPDHQALGWRRYSLGSTSVAEDPAWAVAYHGAARRYVPHIVAGGFRSTPGLGVYVSPSLGYASHPRYSAIEERSGRHYQLVLEVRVDQAKVLGRGPGTLDGFLDAGLEWRVLPEGLLISGIMVRCTDDHHGA